MTMSRWKLLAGVFGLSVCGLAALAEPACRTSGHGTNRQLPPVAEVKPKAEPKPEVGAVLPPPLQVLPPKPADVMPTPAPAPLPALPPAAEPPKSIDLTLPMVKDDKPKTETLPSLPLPGTSNIPPATAVPDPAPMGALPALPVMGGTDGKAHKPEVLPALPAGAPALPTVNASEPPSPATGGNPIGVLPLPTPGPAPVPDAKPLLPSPMAPEIKPLPLPTPMPDTKPVPLPAPKQLEPLLPQPTPPAPQPTPTPELKPVESRGAMPVVEKRLKVTLQMGEGNPRFEIRDGDEVVLKVVSDKVDVKAPTEKGDLWSTLKASGRVKFHSPGGDGYCDELTITPGSCEVIATGKVQFKYNWGKVETAVTSERMTFRLGAMPETR